MNSHGQESEPVVRCELCGRAVDEVTRHHLVPRCRSRKARRRPKARARLQARLRGDDAKGGAPSIDDKPLPDETVDLCRPCHKMVHATLSEKEMEQQYHSLAALRSHPQIARFLRWVRRQPGDRRLIVRRSRTRRDEASPRRRRGK